MIHFAWEFVFGHFYLALLFFHFDLTGLLFEHWCRLCVLYHEDGTFIHAYMFCVLLRRFLWGMRLIFYGTANLWIIHWVCPRQLLPLAAVSVESVAIASQPIVNCLVRRHRARHADLRRACIDEVWNRLFIVVESAQLVRQFWVGLLERRVGKGFLNVLDHRVLRLLGDLDLGIDALDRTHEVRFLARFLFKKLHRVLFRDSRQIVEVLLWLHTVTLFDEFPDALCSPVSCRLGLFFNKLPLRSFALALVGKIFVPIFEVHLGLCDIGSLRRSDLFLLAVFHCQAFPCV